MRQCFFMILQLWRRKRLVGYRSSLVAHCFHFRARLIMKPFQLSRVSKIFAWFSKQNATLVKIKAHLLCLHLYFKSRLLPLLHFECTRLRTTACLALCFDSHRFHNKQHSILCLPIFFSCATSKYCDFPFRAMFVQHIFFLNSSPQ